MIALPSIAFGGFSGSAKGVTARQVGGRSILSLKCFPTGVATSAQVARRASMSKITKSWKTLTEAQMLGWDHLAEHTSGQSVFGQAAQISGLNLYIRLNVSRTMAGESILHDAPEQLVCLPNVVYDKLWVTTKNIVIKGMKNTRTPQQPAADAPQITVQETGVIDIPLRDIEGTTRHLTELKGKVVIIDFTIYQSAVSASHNYMLRDLYDKYASQGLEIYQVSLDADEHYWKTTAANLPWICVRDGNGIYSSYATAYNIQNLPTLFLMNRTNELVARSETIKDLEKEVKALL